MATYSSSLRSGLPRVEGGDPWPPEGTIGEPLEEGASWLPETSDTEELDEGSPAEAAESDVTEAEESTETVASADAEDSVEGSTEETAEDSFEEPADDSSDSSTGAAVAAGAGAAGVAAGAAGVAAAGDDDAENSADASAVAEPAAPAAEVPLRRGLPRVEGGEPWPPEGLAPAGAKATGASAAPAVSAEAPASEEPAAEESASVESDEESSAAPAAAAATAGVGAVAGAAVAASASDDESTAEETAAAPAAESAPAAEVPLRRGLPRVEGGDPWPPEGFAPAGAKAAGGSTAGAAPAAAAPAESTAEETVAQAETPSADTAADSTSESSSAAPAAAAAAGAGAAGVAAAAVSGSGSGELSDVPLRRGLPRTAGGDPWPPEGFAPATAVKTAGAGQAAAAAPAEAAKPADDAQSTAETKQDSKPAAGDESGEKKPQGRRTGIGGVGAGAAAAGAGAAAGAAVAGAGAASASEKKSDEAEKKPAQRKPMAKPAAKTADKPAQRKPMAKPAATNDDKAAARTADKPAAKTAPAAKATSSGSGSTASAKPAAKKEPIMIGSKSLGQWSKLVGLGLGGLIVAAGILILAARGVTTLPGVPEFLERYPGEYHIPDFVDPGFPGWVRWTHFLNIFFMVLIIRSGLQVRHQQKPPAFYTPKNGGKKISINLWLHTSLDLLWLANGVVFVVLLFVSGHWARIVPTSWEVFPNALSAALQYATMEWPMEDAWVNYNALQQLMYFIVVFIAAPLAAITGVRMSEWWPKDASTLNKIYPAPLARAIHFPTMLFFVFFILVHVFLVFTTGLRQNLGYMFAGTDVVGWAGLIWFLIAMVVVVAGWFAARPLLLAPIANLFGRVSSR
ncbi:MULTISPECIES: cytochrome b/b6 domain-containing protein [Brevibacterium]|uniref:Cytochrome b561 bacterial/Ni-hydrogenase domain-containing protein n=1 Tax=Brevibacterium ammoniilyticum TaxID=1046555 RepID=A0ABP9U242_9MICO